MTLEKGHRDRPFNASHSLSNRGSEHPLKVLVSGLRAVDVARISGVSQSTLSRFWEDPNWLEHVGGATLARLTAVFPPIDHYVRASGERIRINAAVQLVRTTGTEVRDEEVSRLLVSAPTSAVITALFAAVQMINGHHSDASRMLSVGWSQKSNQVVDSLFAHDESNILEDSDKFLMSSHYFLENSPPISSHAEVVGYGIVKHKLTKIGHEPALSDHHPKFEDSIAFLDRSKVIGRILRENDLAMVDWYRKRVATQNELASNEIWSHATYSHDIPIRLRKLPRQIRLRSATLMAINDIQTQNDAYAYYLLTVALPLFLAADPQVGGHGKPLLEKLRDVSQRPPNSAVQVAARKLYEKLAASIRPGGASGNDRG
ncbi:hypothetical protein [Mycobacteroides abscessus]|uniref:hypothetical protein n=1 Tax=Mycobacteroides abscessus TaxID=36809 RepID=UPI0018A57F81|nr:hypothetical protein [Mycobacteroides abscessus]QOF34643.1 hypothetical protein E3G57_003559 [Mycobacteroides abscessus]